MFQVAARQAGIGGNLQNQAAGGSSGRCSTGRQCSIIARRTAGEAGRQAGPRCIRGRRHPGSAGRPRQAEAGTKRPVCRQAGPRQNDLQVTAPAVVAVVLR